MNREEALLQEGWIKRSHYDEPRLSEVIQMYREIGFEVHTEPVRLKDAPGCNECMKTCLDKFKMVYTRKTADDLEDL
jgi:hypothetical protein